MLRQGLGQVPESLQASINRLADASASPGRVPPPAQIETLGRAFGVQPDTVTPRVDDEARARTAKRRSHGLMAEGTIYLDPGRYAPETPEGRYLLAHEAAHVVQARLGSAVPANRQAAEAEAHAIGTAFASGQSIPRPRIGLAATADAADTDYDGSEAAWSATDDEPSTRVGKPGRVGGPDLTFGSQKRIYRRPDTNLPPSGHIAFDTPIWVERENEHGWYYVYTASGTAGWVQRAWVAVDPPEPNASLHPIAPGETLKDIAARYYRGQAGFVWGADARLFVEALVHANEMAGRTGIQRVASELSAWEELVRSEEDEQTLRIWRSARVMAGHCIWIPSPDFVRQLGATGAISKHGGSATHALWSEAKGAAGKVWTWAQLGAGFVAGLVRGALESVWDLLASIPELMIAVGKVIRSLVTGNILQDAEALWEALKSIDPAGVAQAFLARWNAEEPWARGMFRGRVCGYVLAEIALLMFSGGIASAVKALGKFGHIAKLLGKSAHIGKLATRIRESKALLEHGDRLRQTLDKTIGATKKPLPKVFCFPAGTLVVTSRGPVPIERISAGDAVESFDFSTGTTIDADVTTVSVGWTEKLLEIGLGDLALAATPKHAFWVDCAQQWLEAAELQAGMMLRLRDGQQRPIQRIREQHGLHQVHNLEIRGTHNYYVTEQGVLVHNGGPDVELADFEQARNAALAWLEERGFRAEKQVLSKMRKDPSFGRPIGMSTKDGRIGFRVEFDARSGPHINVFAGKEKGPHFKFQGTQNTVNKIIKRFLCH